MSFVLILSLAPFMEKEASAAAPSPKREFRAVWIASVANIDWPSKKGLSAKKQKAEFIKLMDDAKKMGMNAVIVQIKPAADALYPSKYGPWSEYLTGTQGKSPGYDPLAFMIEEAHKRNLEFHAWFNPYRITMNHQNVNKLAKNHPARQHPEWVRKYGKQLYYDPGLPEVRNYIIEEIMEVVSKYDIDGVHMDDYFYPYRIPGKDFPDSGTYKDYGAAYFTSKADWRRDNVNMLVSGIHQAIKMEKPYVKFGISPFGVWRNKKDDPTGSNTKAGQRNYDDLYADTRAWINNGYVDYINPQIYWNIGYKAAPFEVLADWWGKETAGKPVHLYIGQAAYKIKKRNAGKWSNPNEYPNQIQLTRSNPNIQGSVHFSMKDVNRNTLGVKDKLSKAIYKQPALVPAMPWLDSEAPKAPELLQAISSRKGMDLYVADLAENDTAYYAIYRFNGTSKGSVEQPGALIDTARKLDAEQVYTDKTALKGRTYTYVITALDRLHNESGESVSITVKK